MIDLVNIRPLKKKRYISNITGDDEYRKMQEDLMYGELAKVNYKRCSKCGRGESSSIKSRKRIRFYLVSPNYPVLCGPCDSKERRANYNEDEKNRLYKIRHERYLLKMKENPNWNKEKHLKYRDKRLAYNKQYHIEHKEYEKLRRKLWYENNIEHVRKYGKKWHEEHKEYVAIKRKLWYENNRKRYIQLTTIWIRENRDRRNRKSRENYQVNKDRILSRNKKWRMKNREKLSIIQSNRYRKYIENDPNYNKKHYQRQLELHGKDEVNRRNRKWYKNNPEKKKVVQRNYILRKKIFNMERLKK